MERLYRLLKNSLMPSFEGVHLQVCRHNFFSLPRGAFQADERSAVTVAAENHSQPGLSPTHAASYQGTTSVVPKS
jgi:hypothetical protein